MKSIKKVLVANRGEIAIRVFRTCYEMGIKTVAVFSDADKSALFVEKADEAICIGGTQASESYLLQDKIIAAAKQTGADAIHPGYGFLSENASFAKRCKDEGIIFIGPSAEVIQKLGSKIAAKEIAKSAGVPTVPGYNGDDQSTGRLKYEAEEIGYPVLIKASAGGGGKGMRIVNSANELESALEGAKREAEKSFGDGSLLIEKYFAKAKHIEFQIFGDEHGNHFHLLERECSMQRRYQKVIEECPSPSLNEELRAEMGEAAVAIARAVNYTNAGTVEFLFAPATENSEAAYYFLEVNTRLQVEHPVTESITFTDLVQMQLMAAEGRVVEPRLTEEFVPMMHAIECRICAEDAENSFFPSTGKILLCNQPALAGVRYDSGIESGSEVSVHYDSMIAKVISIGEDRAGAIQQMLYALDQYAVLGITTNTGFLKELLLHPQFVDGTFDTKLIERDFTGYKKEVTEKTLHEIAVAALLYDWYSRREFEAYSHSLNGWRNIFYQSQFYEVEFLGNKMRVEYRYRQSNKFDLSISGKSYTAELMGADDNQVVFQLNNHVQSFFMARNNEDVFIHHPAAGDFKLKEVPRFTEPGNELQKGGYVAPMPGEIVKVLVKAGDKIQSGKGLLVMSSMKMETTIEAHTDGEVEEVFVTEKNFVEAGTVLLKMKSE
jgi:acetyl-CoA carboxylase biotin carboxylase subunit